MNRRFILVFIVLNCCVLGCGNQHERLKVKLTKVITSYVEENMSGFKVDSVEIMAIDSLTDFDFAYFQKVIFENKESQILSNPMLYRYSDTDEEFETQEDLRLQLQTVQNHIYLCDSILLDDRTDTLALQYFFVVTRIFGKDKTGENKTHEIGFPIDKNFTVTEIDMDYK